MCFTLNHSSCPIIYIFHIKDLLLSTFASQTLPNPSHKRSSSKTRTAYSSRKQLIAECIQRCLIYLGDLARYRECIADVEGNEKWEFAKRFYLTAAILLIGGLINGNKFIKAHKTTYRDAEND